MNIRPDSVFWRSRILTEKCHARGTFKRYPALAKSPFPLFPPVPF